MTYTFDRKICITMHLEIQMKSESFLAMLLEASRRLTCSNFAEQYNIFKQMFQVEAMRTHLHMTEKVSEYVLSHTCSAVTDILIYFLQSNM